MPRFQYLFGLFLAAIPAPAPAHDAPLPREETTYTIDAPRDPGADSPRLVLQIIDSTTGQPTPARFSISIDGKPWAPPALNKHGIRFTSIHTGKKQSATVLYARGTGPVALSLPKNAMEAELVVTKGYTYLAERIPFTIPAAPGATELTATIRRWSAIRDEGWRAADEHLHYERGDPAHDADWFTMLQADGLDHGFFMILEGGNVPGIWSQQFAYGDRGRIDDPESGVTLTPGEEFRGSFQGHNNLHGIAEIIVPITVGGNKAAPHSFNWPATHDVLARVRDSGGIGGPAHGGTFGKASTAVLDAVLGATGFFELANTHLYELNPWYRLLNCGFIIPPVAGTDLPNFPFRGSWQPFFGETRTCVRIDNAGPGTGSSGFESWKEALALGRVFITSGPLISLTVSTEESTGEENVRLPAGGGKIRIEAELSSPQPPSEFEIVRNGQPLPVAIEKSRDADGVHHWKIREDLKLHESSWIAARGKGVRKDVLWAKTGVIQHAMAHTAAIPVLAGDAPIFSEADAAELIRELEAHRKIYATEAKFPDDESRSRMLSLFDEAIEKLQR